MRFQISFRRFFAIWLLIAIFLGLWLIEKRSTDVQFTTLRNSGVRVTRYGSWVSLIRPSYVSVELEFPAGDISIPALQAASKLRAIASIAAEWNACNSPILNAIVAGDSVTTVTFLNATDKLFPLSDSFRSTTDYKFRGEQFSGNGIATMVGADKVTSLDLSGTAFCDSSILELKDFSSLNSLNLDFTRVSNEGLKSLGGFPLSRLTSLSADCVEVTGDAAKYLIGMKLEFLKFYVHRRERDNQSIPYYKKHFPNCKFVSTFLLEPREASPTQDVDDPFG